jgi:predicted MarR family transcription regulator
VRRVDKRESRSANPQPRARQAAEPETTAEHEAADSATYMSRDAISAALTRLELGVVRAHEALASWGTELHKHVSGEQLSWQETAVLHCVRMRGSNPTLAEMLLFLHRHDLAALQYCLKKLENHGFIRRSRGASRREIAFSITEKGREVTDAYARARQEILVELCRQVLDLQPTLIHAAQALERMVGIYDQATQSIFNHRLTTPRGP